MVDIRKSELARARALIIPAIANTDVEAHHAACVLAECLAKILRHPKMSPLRPARMERLVSDCEGFARAFAKLAR